MELKDKLELAKEKGYTYDNETGYVKSKLGKIVKCNVNGYIQFGPGLFAHQYAWYITYNEIPTEIDHIDRIRNNNKISNLRCVEHSINTQNTNAKGFVYDKERSKYRVRIYINGKNIYLGEYNNSIEAHQAYLDAKKIYHKKI